MREVQNVRSAHFPPSYRRATTLPIVAELPPVVEPARGFVSRAWHAFAWFALARTLGHEALSALDDGGAHLPGALYALTWGAAAGVAFFADHRRLGCPVVAVLLWGFVLAVPTTYLWPALFHGYAEIGMQAPGWMQAWNHLGVVGPLAGALAIGLALRGRGGEPGAFAGAALALALLYGSVPLLGPVVAMVAPPEPELAQAIGLPLALYLVWAVATPVGVWTAWTLGPRLQRHVDAAFARWTAYRAARRAP